MPAGRVSRERLWGEPGVGPNVVRATCTVLLGLAGGLLGDLSGFPGGGLLGALVAVSVYSLMSDGAAYVPRSAKTLSRIVAGTTVGSLMTTAILVEIRHFAVWAVVSTVALVAVGLLSGLALEKFTPLDRATALMASLPGGLSEMALMAEDVGARTDVVLAVHIVRKMTVLFVIALCIHWLGTS